MPLNSCNTEVIKGKIGKMLETLRNLETKSAKETCRYTAGKFLNMNKSSFPKGNSQGCSVSSGVKVVGTPNSDVKSDRCLRTKYRKMKFSSRNPAVKRVLLKCRICAALNKTKSSLLKHLQSHVGTPVSCNECKRSFNNNPSYLCHLSLKMCKEYRPVIKKYNCDQCPKRHVEGHKRNNCTYCDARLTRRKQLVQHLLTVHSIKLERAVMFECEYCEKRYVKKRSLYYHLKQHAENKIVCMECGFMSLNVEEHQKHFTEHDNDRPWKCEKCNDRFSRRQQYLIHLKRHDRYKCTTCNETFASKARVMRHKQRGHAVQGLEPQMKCPHCPLAFQRRLSLQIHMKKHTDDKLMYCKYCNKKFHSPYLYFKHCTTTIHEMNSPEKQQLVCEICGKLFVKKYQLEQHLHRVHDHKKQSFNCEYCGYRTTSRKNLERHLSLHLEDKKEIICDKCGKAFYNITTLKDHITYVHSHERHFKCNQCDKAFKRNSELVRHKTSHSELRPHVCKTCGVSYKRSTHLRRHEESQHGTTSKTRRVQRLKKDENGILVPVPEEKKAKKTKKKTPNITKQIVSIMDAHSGEMVTFTLPHCNITAVLNMNSHSYNSDLIQAVDLPYQPTNLVMNSAETLTLPENLTNQTLHLVDTVDSSFTNTLLSNEPYSNTQLAAPFVPTNILPDPSLQIQSPTCDILLPETRLLNLQTHQKDSYVTGDYTQNPYQYL